jgi:hypothetical protein
MKKRFNANHYRKQIRFLVKIIKTLQYAVEYKNLTHERLIRENEELIKEIHKWHDWSEKHPDGK